MINIKGRSPLLVTLGLMKIRLVSGSIGSDAEVKYPAAAAGPEGLPPGHEPFRGGAWPGGSCRASNSLKNFLPPEAVSQ
jgi:hypothetical protein